MEHINLSQIRELIEKLWWTTHYAPCNLQVHEDLVELQRMARRIQAILNYVEKMEIKDESVQFWLKDLKGLAYDAEDVLDEYNYELLRAKVKIGIQPDEVTHHFPYKRKHHAVSKSTMTSISLDASFCSEIADKIRKIRDRFEDISKQYHALHLREEDEQKRSLVIAYRLPSSHIVDAPKIYGREADLEMVIDRLLYSDECEKSNLLVLPIVGIRGVGKTTLVQHVYNDPRICDHFQMKGWVSVSDDFRIEKLTKRIFESFTKGHCDVKEFSVIQERLKELLDGKRFLLVLDDVWSENLTLWESLQKSLRFGVQGSAVITTMRSEFVATIMKTVPFYCLNRLSLNDCFAVFVKSAFVDRDPDDHPDLVKIGMEIVRKCDGLPLVAKSLGGLLRYKNVAHEWDKVLQSDIWERMEHMTQFMNPCLERSDAIGPSLGTEKAFIQVMGQDRPKLIYSSGQGKTKKLWYGYPEASCNTNTSIRAVQSEIDMLKVLLIQQHDEHKAELSALRTLIESSFERLISSMGHTTPPQPPQLATKVGGEGDGEDKDERGEDRNVESDWGLDS